MPYVEIDNNKYYYCGNPHKPGIPVVFLHGSGGNHHHWIYQLKNLPPQINPLVPDLPGHGRSAGKPAGSITVYRKWLRLFIKALKLENLLLAGHSMGGAIVLEYALHHPEKLQGIILIGTGARLKVLPAFLESLQEGRVPAGLVDFLYGPGAPQNLLKEARREVGSTPAPLYYSDLSACNSFDISSELPDIKAPAQMICGSEDRLTPLKYSNFLQEKLNQGSVAVIPQAGHMVMLEQPDAVNQVISEFAASVAGHKYSK